VAFSFYNHPAAAFTAEQGRVTSFINKDMEMGTHLKTVHEEHNGNKNEGAGGGRSFTKSNLFPKVLRNRTSVACALRVAASKNVQMCSLTPSPDTFTNRNLSACN